MCLLVVAWRTHPRYRVVVAANRDEFHMRPTAPLARWAEPPILAGRDLQAGGTWLGLDSRRRFGLVTNFRELARPRHTAPSRGRLVPGFLASPLSAPTYLDTLETDAQGYAGFNLLLGDAGGLWYCATPMPPRRLDPGVYGLSNGQLDTPWPKVVKGRRALQAQLAAPTVGGLLAILADRTAAADHELPDTGIGIELERSLSSCFILGDEYGTRASTALLIDRRGVATVAEQNFGPGGVPRELRQWQWPLAAVPC